MVLAVCAAGLNAAPITNNATGLTAPTNTITFSEVAVTPGTLLTNEFAPYGITTTNLYYDPFPAYAPLATVTVGNFNDATESPCGGANELPCQPFSIHFLSPKIAAAFQIVTIEGLTTFTARLNGIDVQSFIAATFPRPAYYGFTDVVFDEIHVNTAGISNGAALIDNLQMANTPEPSTWFLLITGLSLIGAARARR